MLVTLYTSLVFDVNHNLQMYLRYPIPVDILSTHCFCCLVHCSPFCCFLKNLAPLPHPFCVHHLFVLWIAALNLCHLDELDTAVSYTFCWQAALH